MARSPAAPSENLSDRAYQAIRDKMVSGALRPGDRLILRPLARELGLSPTPVREALLRLLSEQALTMDERGSATVPLMTIDLFDELSMLRGDLEMRAIERAISRATDAEIEVVEALNEACRAAFRDGDHTEMLKRNIAFHRGICAAGQSTLTLNALEGLWVRLGPIYAPNMESAVSSMSVERHPHTRMLEAMRQRDIQAAREAALADISEGYRFFGADLVRNWSGTEVDGPAQQADGPSRPPDGPVA